MFDYVLFLCMDVLSKSYRNILCFRLKFSLVSYHKSKRREPVLFVLRSNPRPYISVTLKEVNQDRCVFIDDRTLVSDLGGGKENKILIFWY